MDNKNSHITFKKTWELTDEILYELGQCNAVIKAIDETPIQPNYRETLLRVSITKGAQSTTAIEGNTLSDEEIELIQKGKDLPPSKEHQQKEVQNIIDAFNELLNEAVTNNDGILINEKFILRLHKMVGKNLGDNFNAIPGKFRDHQVVVGPYRAPDHSEVKDLTKQFCDWMKEQFHYEKGQNFIDAVIQAIVSHVYIAWIHPFGDGNGRTARLLEFYILLRAGNPDFALHILSNFYNQTRPEYYRHLDKSNKTGDLTEFIAYAVKGYRDGLFSILELIQRNQMEISWKNYIYDIFNSNKVSGKSELLNKRRRNLILSIPLNEYYTIEQLIKINIDIALEYKDLSSRTIDRDIKELMNLKLLSVDNNGFYYANYYDLLKKDIPRKIHKNMQTKE